VQVEAYWHKRVDQLSKGNQQKVQFVAAVAHNPPLVILDEPFSGLDPVNVQVLYESLTYLREQGVTILFSSHRLEAVEQMCTDVALIHKSKLVLSGELKAVKRQAGRQMVRLAVGGSFQFLDQFAGCAIMKETPNYTEIKVPASVDPQALLRAAIDVGPVTRFEVEDPSLEEIYLEHVRGVSA
jgi:ABC-2 type transport system ATP-binding protein